MALLIRFLPVLSKPLRTLSAPTQRASIHRHVAPVLKALKAREYKQGGKKINPRNTFLDWNLEAELYAFGKRLNEDFDADLLLQAFIDRSYVIKEEMKQKELDFDFKMKDNRELAEEGAKFMKNYIESYLQAALPKLPLAGISSIAKHLTSEETLAHVSLNLGTKDIILAADYPLDGTTLATAFEALVGALRQSSGEERTGLFVRDFVITLLQGQDVNEFWHIEDPYSMLASLLKSDNLEVEPRLIGEVGRNTLLACFRVGLYVDKQLISSGFGEKVSIAKEMAAREALKKIFGTEDNMKPINFKPKGVPKPDSNVRYQIASS